MFQLFEDAAGPYLAREQVFVDAVLRRERVAVLGGGTVVPLGTLLDRDGDETDNSENAVVALASLPDGRWLVIDLQAFEPTKLH